MEGTEATEAADTEAMLEAAAMGEAEVMAVITVVAEDMVVMGAADIVEREKLLQSLKRKPNLKPPPIQHSTATMAVLSADMVILPILPTASPDHMLVDIL